MDQDRSDKLDAMVAALRSGLEDLQPPGPSDLTLTIYAACIIDGIERHGYKIVKSDA
jgi:hypothetical protein